MTFCITLDLRITRCQMLGNLMGLRYKDLYSVKRRSLIYHCCLFWICAYFDGFSMNYHSSILDRYTLLSHQNQFQVLNHYGLRICFILFLWCSFRCCHEINKDMLASVSLGNGVCQILEALISSCVFLKCHLLQQHKDIFDQRRHQ